MKIAIEAQRIFRPNKHGMDFVALETIRELQKIDKENEYFIFVSPGTDRCLEETGNVHIIEVKCPTYPLWEQWALPRAIKKCKPDLLHCTSNTAPLHIQVPLILTLHDIIFLEDRQDSSKSLYQNMGWYYRRLVVPRILPKCRKIVTVSHFERDRIRETLHLPEDRILAVHNGFSSYFHPLDNIKAVTQKYIPATGYLFFLGNTDPKKNTPRTLKAYHLYLQQSKEKRPLLIADLKPEYVDEILKETGLEDIRPDLHLPGYIANTDLPFIYNGAFTFLYTSLRESFGIPLLEAMACGIPVITSNTSSMPEIGGEGAILTDPADEQSIAVQLLLLEQDKEYYLKQSAYGLGRAKCFSWEQTARKLLKLYQSTVKSK